MQRQGVKIICRSIATAVAIIRAVHVYSGGLNLKNVAQWIVQPPATRLNPLALYIGGGINGDIKPPLLTSSFVGGSHRIACNVASGPVAFANGSASPVQTGHDRFRVPCRVLG